MDDTNNIKSRASHEEMPSLLDALPHAVYKCDTDGRIYYHNNAYSEISGYSSDEISRMRVWDFQAPGPARDELPDLLKHLASEQPEPEPYYTKNMNRDGRVIDVLVDWRYMRDASGLVTGFACILSDVTERMQSERILKQSEEALKDSERRFRLLARLMPEIVFETDPEGKLTFTNENAYDVLGYTEEDLEAGVNALEFIVPEHRDRAKANLGRVMAGEDIGVSEYEVLKGDGSRVPVLIRTSRRVENGKLTGLCGIIVEISDRKRMEDDLRQSEQRYRMLFETASDAIMVLKDEKFVDCNARAVEMFKCADKYALIGRRPDELSPELQPDGVPSAEKVEALKRIIVEEQNSRFEWRHKREDGSEFDVEITITLMDIGEEEHILSIVRDITERKRMEDDLRQAVSDKDQLISEIHHRVKNNLLIIQSLLRLQSGGIEDEISREYLLASEDRIRVISMIHERLYRSGDPRGLDAKEYIEALAGQLYRMYKASTDVIRLEVDVSVDWIDVDAAIPCGLIISELLTNSLKHAFPDGREGTIYVALKHQKDGQSLLSVRDTGIGLPEDLDIEQADTLGLKIVSTLSRQLRGTIDLERIGGVWVRVSFMEKRFSSP